MKLPHSVCEVLREHVVLESECIDRMYLNVYVPQLQRIGGVVWYLRGHLGQRFASTAGVAPKTDAFVANIERFVAEQGVEMVSFAKHQRKDDVTQQYLQQFDADEGVLYVGRAQEKARVVRTERRRSATTGMTYPWVVDGSAMVNHYYFYCVDEDFGPFFLKFCSYFPYNAKLCINGNEYAKCQLRKRGIEFEALDNGVLSCADPKALQRICDGLDDKKIDRLLRKWLARLPHPFDRRDRMAGYRYGVSILQAEFALTQVLDRPVAGRIFFEQVIRENLDIGRPGQVQLIFDRRVSRRTPGRFRTRVITEGVTPSLHVDYKRSRIKQYHKEGPGLEDRDHHQRHARLRRGAAVEEPARVAPHRLCRQPAAARDRADQSRLRAGRRRLPASAATASGRRPARTRAALRRRQCPSRSQCGADVRVRRARVHQQGPAPAVRRLARQDVPTRSPRGA